jgi:hypothetical protein
LGAIAYKEFLSIYTDISAYALSAFASNKKLRKVMLMVMEEEHFQYALRNLLQ